MVRTGKAVERFSVENYGAFYAGMYRELRDTILYRARHTADDQLRCESVRNAIAAHRAMFRCLREAKRDKGVAV